MCWYSVCRGVALASGVPTAIRSTFRPLLAATTPPYAVSILAGTFFATTVADRVELPPSISGLASNFGSRTLNFLLFSFTWMGSAFAEMASDFLLAEAPGVAALLTSSNS